MEEDGNGRSGSDQLDQLLNRLNLQDEDDGGFVWEDDIADPPVAVKWLAMARVLTERSFSQSALFADMRSAWNPAKSVIWRRVEDNLFTVQFGCLADWNKAMKLGPWFFRNQTLLIEEYDGYTTPKLVVLDKLAVWAQIHKLPDNFLHENIIKGICRPIGDVLDVQLKLPAGFVGEFVRVRVNMKVTKKITQFV